METIIISLVSVIALLLIWTFKLSRDIKIQSINEHKLLYEAEHDSLTGLANGTLLMDRLSQSIKNAKRFKKKIAILYLGLDNFTDFNDKNGLNTGNHILKKLAQNLKTTLRDSDTVARIGGDEFIIILDHFENTAFIRSVVDKIMKLSKTPILFHDQEMHITFSLGVSIYPDDTLNPKTILENASVTMHKVKTSGKDNYQFYTKEFARETQKRAKLEKELLESLNNQQMEIKYQFQIDSSKNTILGMQTSLQWNHPVRGLLLEDEFLPLAQEINFIHTLENWLTQTSILQFESWRKEKLPVGKLFVSLSTQRLSKEYFLRSLGELINKNPSLKQYLEFTLTEEDLMRNPSEFVNPLETLKRLGLMISLSHAGIQCSSAIALKSLGIHTIELDSSLIDNTDVSKAIIAMATALDIQVAAAGVKNEEQMKRLQSYGCTHIKGDLYHHASSTDSIHTVLLSKVKK